MNSEVHRRSFEVKVLSSEAQVLLSEVEVIIFYPHSQLPNPHLNRLNT
ncbi:MULTISPECIES: hypothetical protein [unclassified Nostoc]|nr:hypothetical protein [Nostoc sp. 'Peltigera membranacea cyanobiont' 213]